MMLDYCIVGGGVIGCAIGKTLLENNPDLKIEIVEQFSGPGQGNTIRSNAAYRNIFDTIINMKLASSSIQYFKAMEMEGHQFGRKEIGYLFLITEEQFKTYSDPNLEYNGKKMSFFDFIESHDISYRIYSDDELRKIYPELELTPENKTGRIINAKQIRYGFLGKQCGNFSPDLVVDHYAKLFRDAGGTIKTGMRVRRLILGGKTDNFQFDPDYIPKVWEEKRVTGIEIAKSDGEVEYIQSKNFILATGAWINQLLDPLGSRSLIKPKKRQLFTINNLEKFISNSNFDTDHDIFPFTILPTGGVFIKPMKHANCVVVGASDVVGRKFERNYNSNLDRLEELDNPYAEEDFFINNILPVLQSYFPSIFDNIQAKGTAGHYAYSIDKYPVIDQVENVDNLFFASGASGSGIMKVDSIARIVVARILGQEKATLFNGDQIDVSRFSIKYRDLPEETLVF